MNPKQRSRYFTDLWPAACEAQGWERKDEAQRRIVTREAMQLCRAGDITSTTDMDEAEVTALFVYLAFLGDPNHVEKAADWTECQRDYQSFNKLRQARHWGSKNGYQKNGRIERDRFKGRVPGSSLDRPMSAKEVDQYLLTQRSAFQARQGKMKRRQPRRAAQEDSASRPRTETKTIVPDEIECPF